MDNEANPRSIIRIGIIGYNLERGDEISTMLQREIQESNIWVAVCSENAANSNWCLVETGIMTECKEIIFPVFCDVNPSRHCLVNCDTGSVKKMMCGNILGEFMHHGSLENHLFGNGWRSDYGEAGSFKHTAGRWGADDPDDKVHKNHHPRMLHDDVWRLENIGKEGALHRKLSAAGIKTVQDFLKFAVTDSPKLRKTLVIGMSDKMLPATLTNTMTCGTASKTHMCCAPQCTVICRLARADINGQTFINRDLMSHGGANVWPLSWGSRLKVMIGVARGLSFLHSSEKKVIYRDFKASNILLETNYNTKLSDFGLAKFGPSEGQSHVSTRVMGTYGYAAPGNLYEKSDVYGFGLVVLEMLIGLRAINAKRNMVEWFKPHLSNKRKLKTIMDAKSEGQYSFTCSQLRKTTASFVLNDAKTRPQMQQQVQNKRMKTAQRVSSSVTTAIVFLMLIYHIFIQFEKEKQHEQVFPLLEPFGFVMFIGAVATMIVVGAPFSGFLTAMLFFWAILMLLISTKSLTELYLPIGVIFMGWNMVMEKQSPYQV